MGLEEALQISDYRIFQEAGRGNFGIVYKAQEISSGKERAIKVLDRIEGGRGDAAYVLFGSEGLEQNEVLADAFQHENLVRFYRQGIVEDGLFCGQKYIVLEWVEGTTLEHLTALSPRETHVIIKQICRGVEHMHERGYLHNDIRAPNVMVTSSPAKKHSPLAKLGDYTLVTPCNEKGIASAAANISSRTISAPESIHNGELSTRTDIWGLGILMYRLWTGEHPFPHEKKDVLEEFVRNPTSYSGLEHRIQHHPHIPQKYKPVIQKCLSYNPAHRYQSVEALLHDLEPPKTRLSLGSVVAGLLLAGVGCLGLTLGGLFYSQKPDPVVETKTEVQYVPSVFSDHRMVKRDPRIRQGTDRKDVCNHPEKYGASPEWYKNPLEYRFCLEFYEAEKLLDQADFVAAAKKLEALRKEYPQSSRPVVALLEAYYELLLIQEAFETKRIIRNEFEVDGAMELEYYGNKIEQKLFRAPTSLTFASREICTLESVLKKYPECPALVSLQALSSPEEKEKAYASLVSKYPHSFLVHREYARLLFETTDAVEIQYDGVVVGVHYDHLSQITAALQHYKAAARLAKNTFAFFEEISDAFEKHNDLALAFVYRCRAEEALEKDFSRILLGHQESDTLFGKIQRRNKTAFVSVSRQEAYLVLAEKCTGNAAFGIVPCTL